MMTWRGKRKKDREKKKKERECRSLFRRRRFVRSIPLPHAFSLSLSPSQLHKKKPPTTRLMFFEQAREHAEREYSRNKRDTQVRKRKRESFFLCFFSFIFYFDGITMVLFSFVFLLELRRRSSFLSFGAVEEITFVSCPQKTEK